MAKIAVLDYGSGNLRSAQRALERVGASVTVTADPGLTRQADGLVVPGVGAFAACMAGISGIGAGPLIRDWAAADRPLLGICVGMQVLFDAGVEHGVETPGLGVLRGRVEKLNAPILPHMGWNTVEIPSESLLFKGIPDGTRFYFVHSYAAHQADGVVTACSYGDRFVAAIEHGTVSAAQFHPEKSGDAGAVLLENWLATL